jgi:hypothetical protein
MPISPNKKSFNVTMSLEAYELLKAWGEERDWNVSQTARNIISERLASEYGRSVEELKGIADSTSNPSKKKKS